MRVYLIDGYSLLYRAFYALPQSIATSSGLPTNALYGFTSMVLKLLDSEEEVGIGVVWDSGKPAFRMEIFPEYKAHRSAMPEELKVQLDHLDEVIDEYGVTPEQIPDYKALVGDPSDNIPGVRGIGPKGAANLLQQFGSVQGIYDNLDEISAKGTRNKLEEGRESAFMSLELARMRFDAPVKFDEEELRFEGVSPEVGDVLLRRYEFRTLEPRLAELPVVGGGELPRVERLVVRLSGEPVEPSFEPVGVAPVGDPGDEAASWATAVADYEVRVSE